MKVCSKCKAEKPATSENFYKQKTNKDGLHNQCKECRNEYRKSHYKNNKKESKKYYLENKEEILERGSKYRESKKNDSIFKQRELMRVREWRVNNPHKAKKAYTRDNQRRLAREAGVKDTLTEDEWIFSLQFFNNSCAYCGLHQDEIDTVLQREHVVPLAKGGEYTANNIIPACQSCNASKNANSLFKWYPEQKTFSENRMNLIISYYNVTVFKESISI